MLEQLLSFSHIKLQSEENYPGRRRHHIMIKSQFFKNTEQSRKCEHVTERRTAQGRNDRTAREREEPPPGLEVSALLCRTWTGPADRESVRPRLSPTAPGRMTPTDHCTHRQQTTRPKVAWNSHHTVGRDTWQVRRAPVPWLPSTLSPPPVGTPHETTWPL